MLSTVDMAARTAIASMWDQYARLPAAHRALLLRGLLQQSCLPQLSFLADSLNTLLRIDFLAIAPKELALKMLSYLDAKSLCRAARVSRAWKRLADDDVIWHIMCEQHIDKKCVKCGWGLPLLDITKFRVRRRNSVSQGTPIPLNETKLLCSGAAVDIGEASSSSNGKRKAEDDMSGYNSDTKRRAIEDLASASAGSSSSRRSTSPNAIDRLNPSDSHLSLPPADPCGILDQPHHPASHRLSPRPWKEIYAERYQVERNWRERDFRFSFLKGHEGGIASLHFDDASDRLVTGGRTDGLVRLWNVTTGKLEREFAGHDGHTVRTVQIDGPRIWSAGMDGFVRVWDPKKDGAAAVRELSAHDEGGVTSLHVEGARLLTGHEDGKVLFWNLRTATAVKLAGHTDFVNTVRFREKTEIAFSGSDDRTVRMWDLASRQCLRVFNGHNNGVQCIRVSPLSHDPTALVRMVTSADDNTVRIWNVNTGQCLRTIFGHMEGVWSVSFDSLRVVSGGLGGRVRVWDTEDGKELMILDPTRDADNAALDLGHESADEIEAGERGRSIFAVQSTDTKIIAAGADGRVFVYE